MDRENTENGGHVERATLLHKIDMGVIYSVLKSPYFLTSLKNMGYFFIFRQTSTQSTVLTCSSKVLRTNHEATLLSLYRSAILARKCVVMCDQPPFSLWACACMCVVHPFCSFHCPEPHERWKQVPYPVLGDLQWLHVHMKAAAEGKKRPSELQRLGY